jgi:leader peptidase (prepilin peptidase) / N-methyltransferase
VDWTAHLGAAAVAAVLCGLGGLLVPWLIGRLPEPEPESVPEPEQELVPGGGQLRSSGDGSGIASARVADEEPKELYADIAARPRLAPVAAAWAAGSGGLAALAVGWSWSLLVLLPVVPVLVALSVVDFRTRLLPTALIRVATGLVAVGVAIGWVATRDTGDVVRALVGAAIGFLIFFLAWFIHPRGMGYGDVRLAGVLGLALGSLGWGQLLVGLYAGFLIFGVPGLFLALVRRDRSMLRKGYPFGPFMILGALIGVLWGAELWAGITGA